MNTIKVKKLDPRNLPFIDAYIEALFSGEKKPEKTAAEKIGLKTHHGLLKKPGVYEEIKKRINDYLSLTDIDKVRVLLEIKKLAFSSIADVVEFDGKTVKVKSFDEIRNTNPEALDAIQFIKQTSLGEVEVKMFNKAENLDRLSKIFNMQKTVVDLNVGLQKPGLFDDFDPNEVDE